MIDRLICPPRDRLFWMVEQLLAGQAGARAISAEDALTEIGVSSIDMVNLMLTVEAEFDIMIPQSDITPENFRSISTIGALVSRLAQASASEKCFHD
jgi:acyl carrier protein